MLTFFRSFFKSKIGLAITLAFLGLIAFAFASSDVANNATFGGIAGGDRVAVVGDDRIDTAELSRAASNAVDRVREQNPTISMQAFVAQGGLEEVLDQLIDRYAIETYGRKHGLRAGDNLINSEIQQIGSFRGADGNFSQEAYSGALAQQGLTDAMVRGDIGTGLIAQQLLTPAAFGARMPEALARRYAQLFKERREGAIAFLPAGAYAPSADPSDAVLQKFYANSRDDFIRPERRIIRYVAFGSEAIEDSITPTDAEIARRFQQDSAQYAASEDRGYTQLIVPTQQAAATIRDRVSSGASLESVAREAGFQVSVTNSASRSELRSDTSEAVAQTYFNTRRGGITEPARSPLGWHVARIDNVRTRTARTLAQVRGELTETMREEKRLDALADLASEMEELFDGGATLPEVAEQFGLEVQSSRPVTAAGQVYGTQEALPGILAPVLTTAFQMEESEPQVGEVARGETYVAFDVAEITLSAAAPLAEIRDNVVTAWRLSEGSKAARAAADRVIERLENDTDLAVALSAERPTLPPTENISLSREELARRQEQRVPPPLALLFSMAQGTSKKLAAANNLGWFVVDLRDISIGEIDDNDPLIQQARQQLGQQLSDEYTDQLVAAFRKEMGVERNPDAIAAVRRQLTGATAAN